MKPSSLNSNDSHELSPPSRTEVFNTFFPQLVKLAERRLGAARRIVDGEDIAISAMGTFFKRYGEESLANLAQNELWLIVAAITKNKAINKVRDLNRLKRGGGKVRGESVFEDLSDRAGIGNCADEEMTPAELCSTTETVDELFKLLTTEEAAIANRKLEGFTNAEISDELGLSVATVERRLRMIRSRWSQRSS